MKSMDVWDPPVRRMGYHRNQREAETLGGRITALRQRQGWTQKQLSQRIYVASETISQWERNVRTPDVVKAAALADQFRVPVYWLITGGCDPYDSPTLPEKV